MLADLRFAVRQLAKSPGFTTVAILTLALGIGANTAIFSVINGVLLRPLPYDQPEQLMRLYQRSKNFPKATYAAGQFFSVRADQQSFEAIAAWQGANFNLAVAATDPERIEGAVVTADFFRVLRLAPLHGRLFTAGEFTPGADHRVLLSHSLWQERFAGDPAIVGRTLFISGRNREVVGILPDAFSFPGKARLWAPFAPDDENRTRRDLHNLSVFARLKPGVTAGQAQAELVALTARYAKEFANTDADWSCVAFPMLADAVANVRPALLVLVASVAALLLIACANVTNLLLTRATVRARELSIRAALGASRLQLGRQLLVECLVLFTCGGLAGLLVAEWLLDALLALAPASLPRLDQVALDLRVLLFTSAATLTTGLLFGLIPAFNASRTDLTTPLREGGHGSTGGRGGLRSALVVVQVAAAAMLLISSGLLIRSFHRLQQVDTGFDSRAVMTTRVDLPAAKYGGPGQKDETRRQFVADVVRRLQALPGVDSAAVVTNAPLTGGPTFIMRVDGQADVTPSSAPVTRYRTITPDYFKVMGIPLVRGRAFTAQDAPGAPRVVIINQAFAKKFFPGVADPVGQRVEVALDDPPRWGTVVGVVADARIDGLELETPVQAYEPYHEFAFNNLAIVVRARGDPATLATALRREVLAVDPQQPVHTQKTMARIVEESLGQRYFSMLLVAVFAAVALALAGIGLYGVIAYNVAQRTREFGVRIAIGAGPREILRLVLGHGSRLIAAGLALGLVGAFLTTQLMQTLLFGIDERDPLTFAAVTVLLAAVALVATWLPARRATQVDPMIALRAD
jgi:putative ABC transport system permease protein